MKIAVIPARGGSRRIPRKNIRPFCGKPMLAWPLAAALKSGCFDRVVVSTDDEEIAALAVQLGAEVPFMRPASLADDYTGTIPVVRHAIEWFNASGVFPEEVCCLYATAPFVCADDLRKGLQLLLQDGSDYAFTVTHYPFPIQRALRLTPTGRVAMFQPGHFNTRSQDLEPAYHDAGQFYWGKAGAWLAGVPLFGEGSSPLILPAHRVQDIDTPEDWERAELLFRALQADVRPADA